ncbi:MAG TPA: hypothetical protein VK524_25760 [Polyangiaceae bacterium]|nr:hypothetical protein [Polyangiaceae bacterium]
MHVEPIDVGGLPRWRGEPVFLSRTLCESIRDVLTTDDEPDLWSARARAQLKQIRAEHDGIDPDGTTLQPEPTGFRLWTFYGGRTNNLLAKTLESLLGSKIANNNLNLTFKEHAGESEVAIRQALQQLHEQGRPNHEDALKLAELCAHGRLTKFEPCLPDRLLNEYLADELTDLA